MTADQDRSAIVDRLRTAASDSLACTWEVGCRCTFCAAADEIEALSALLRLIVVDVEPGMDGPRPRVVSNRLTPEQGVLLRRVLNGR